MSNFNYRKGSLKIEGLESVCNGSDEEGDLLLVDLLGNTNDQGVSIVIAPDVSKESAVRLLKKTIIWIEGDDSGIVDDLQKSLTTPLVQTPKTH